MSSIDDYYFQNYHVLNDYFGSIDKNKIPLIRGHEPNNEDVLRRAIIFELLLNNELKFSSFEEKFGLENFKSKFSYELSHFIEMV